MIQTSGIIYFFKVDTYYLNGMWTCGPSVLILFQWFQSQFSSKEKLHFTQGFIAISTEPKFLKFQHWTKIKKKKITLKSGKNFLWNIELDDVSDLKIIDKSVVKLLMSLRVSEEDGVLQQVIKLLGISTQPVK